MGSCRATCLQRSRFRTLSGEQTARYATHVAVFHDGVLREVESWDDDGLLGRVYGVDIRVRLDGSGRAIVETSRPHGGPETHERPHVEPKP